MDGSKPFQPFGPLPTTDSYLVVGAWDSARLSLDAAWLDIEWGELPRDRRGWEGYYRDWGENRPGPSFLVETSVVVDQQWIVGRKVTLFKDVVEGARLCPYQTIRLNTPEFLRRVDDLPHREAWEEARAVSSGLVRLRLLQDFGHRYYPTVLTQIMTENARKRKQSPVPRPPYTPIIQALSLSFVQNRSGAT